jgi:spore coat protein U-like protein
VNIAVDLSKGSSPTYTPRTMLNGLIAMNYNLYIDPFGLLIWGDGTGGSFSSGPFGVSNNQTVTLTIYGQIPAGQDLPPGSYGDTITASVNY